MATVSVTDDNFDTEVLKSSKPIVVDFWAEWCGPCKQIYPKLEEYSQKIDEKMEKTQARIKHTLSTGKPLIN